MLVQRGAVVFNGENTTEIVTLDIPVPVGNSYPQYTVVGSGNTFGNIMFEARLSGIEDGNYTQLTLRKSTAEYYTTVTVSWEVLCDPQFDVTYYSVIIADGEQSGTVHFQESIDTTKSYPVFSCWDATGEMWSYADASIRADLSQDSITFTRSGMLGQPVISCYIVEIEGATVTTGETAILSGALSRTIGISGVDPTKAFVMFSWYGEIRTYIPNNAVIAGVINDDNTLQFYKGSAYQDAVAAIRWYIVQHKKMKVARRHLTLTDQQIDTTEIIEKLSPEFSFVVSSAAFEGYINARPPAGCVAVTLASNTTVEVSLNYPLGTKYIELAVVQWATANPPRNLSPDGDSVIPSESNTFTFVLLDERDPELQELRYREQGEEWDELGFELYAGKHVFPAGTFEVGKIYEWQVRYYEAGEDDPSKWSDIATCDTVRPVILNPVPVVESSVKTGILQFGAVLKSPYGRDVELKIEIADNEDFTGPTIYDLPLVHSGQKSIVDHAMTQAGYWWVRMTAIDTLQEQTVLTYRFFAGQFLQFIDFPDIQTQGPQATHITVRAKGTTTEYTAVISPEPPAANKIERLVEIESGTQAQCQKVAEQLLERWGREQRSVSGTVDLIVTLRFDQKIRVKCLPAGIDEEMILQKKEHDVLGNPSTRVTLGDIILSDDELLARVLDELVG